MKNEPSYRERAILGCLLELFPAAPPPNIALLLENAPDSFDDRSNGVLAGVIRDCWKSGKPVSATAISIACSTRNIVLGESTALYIMNTVQDALPLELAEMEAKEVWAAYQVRKSKAVLEEAKDAMDRSPERSEVILRGATKALELLKTDQSAPGPNGSVLPEIVEGSAFVGIPMTEPKELIKGLLHKGCKMSLGGSSKAYKSWSFIDIAISVSHGIPYLTFETNPSRVLYINFENPAWACNRRFARVAQRRGIEIQPDRLYIWNLRGHAASFDTLLPRIISKIGGQQFDMVILDPIYKIYGATDENSATDVAQLLNAIDVISSKTDAATCYGAHFSKGNQAAKEAIDRVSGSGVFARDPDTIVTFTSHEEESAFSVEIVLRNHPPVKPFVVKWDYPIFQTAENLDPAHLKEVTGRPRTYDPDIILDLLDHPMTTSEWQKLAAAEKGVPRASFYRMLDAANTANLVIKSKLNSKWIPQGES